MKPKAAQVSVAFGFIAWVAMSCRGQHEDGVHGTIKTPAWQRGNAECLSS